MLKNKRKDSMVKDRFGHYLLYAAGEIVLIILGILIAVEIDSFREKSKEQELRCTYLNELAYVFNLDINDVNENIAAFDDWIPKMQSLLDADFHKNLKTLDSLPDKFGTVGNYIHFGQRSISKIEELKYSDIDLIKNRSLHNKILIYQDDQISRLRHLEIDYSIIGNNLRDYYAHNFYDFNYTDAVPIDISKIEKDNYYFSLVRQRLRRTKSLKSQYLKMAKTQKEIEKLIEEEIINCKKD